VAHAFKLQPGSSEGIYWPRVLDLAMALTTNFALWALILELPDVLRQL
jgi:hypothetical protein